jgi:Fe-S cluster assembly protein SufD
MDPVQHYLSTFQSLEPALAGIGAPALQGLRKAAMERFAELGLPTARLEEWRFTNVAPIADAAFVPPRETNGNGNGAVGRALERAAFDRMTGQRIVFVNGRYAPGRSSLDRLPAGVIVENLADAVQADPGILEHLTRYASGDDRAFVALNTGFLSDGAFVRIADGTQVEEPICVVFVSTGEGAPSVSYPRVLVLAGDNSEAAVVEGYLAAEGVDASAGDVYFTNAVTEISAGRNARIEHYKLQWESEAAFHVSTVAARQARDSALRSYSISLGGALVRNDLDVVLDGEGADCVLNGLYMVAGRQHVDNHTTIDHVQPHSSSLETYKGVLAGASRAVFSGRIIVRPDAQKIVARQTNKNLLLSEDAVINTKPQLEIHADDVKCFHGATIGMLDDDALFYLRSRGLDLEAARSMLIHAFVSDIVGEVKVTAIRDHLEQLVRARLPVDLDFRGGA